MTDYPDSIDDEFEGCKDKMFDLVSKKLLDEELNSNGNFINAWNQAKSHRSVQMSKSDSELTKKELRDKLRKLAILAYTGTDVYRELNDKMREGRGTYMTGFGLISLHFLITDVIQDYNAIDFPHFGCRNTYRRNNITTEITGPSVRFGGFASSSFSPDKRHFGSETCFIITTCYGADISMISWFGEAEGEVLIPPYEVFESKPVTNIPPELSDCKRVYKLHSERDDSKHKKSNMKCEFFKGMAAAGCRTNHSVHFSWGAGLFSPSKTMVSWCSVRGAAAH
uniref:NAD(P)(+)--arginine ADP-ribosyltransferase n=1 Tax=Pygocentrus nattereri TaxID=42514 RepID=A0A3B4DZE2_PYGNA